MCRVKFRAVGESPDGGDQVTYECFLLLPDRPMAGDMIDLSELLSEDEAYAEANEWFCEATFDIWYMKWEKDAEGFYLAVCLINPVK